jgi:hypothetical protein
LLLLDSWCLDELAHGWDVEELGWLIAEGFHEEGWFVGRHA